MKVTLDKINDMIDKALKLKPQIKYIHIHPSLQKMIPYETDAMGIMWYKNLILHQYCNIWIDPNKIYFFDKIVN